MNSRDRSDDGLLRKAAPPEKHITVHSCYQNAFRCVEYRPKILYVNFDSANSFNGKCCSSKTISARSSAEVSKSPQRGGKVERLKEYSFILFHRIFRIF